MDDDSDLGCLGTVAAVCLIGLGAVLYISSGDKNSEKPKQEVRQEASVTNDVSSTSTSLVEKVNAPVDITSSNQLAAVTSSNQTAIVTNATPVSLVKTNASPAVVKTNSFKPGRLEGFIKDVQSSSIPAWCGNTYATAIPITYVMVRGNDGKLISLVYPASRGIPRGVKASFDYEPTKDGKISMKDLLNKTFISRGQYNIGGGTYLDEQITVDGVIKQDGIEYQGELK